MSLATVFNNAAKTALDAVGDLKVAFGFVSKGTPTYDPSTGTYTSTDITDSLEGVLYDFENREVDGEVVKRGDSKILIKQADIAQPERNYDSVTQGSKTWDIVSVQSVPGDSIAIFHVRLQNG